MTAKQQFLGYVVASDGMVACDRLSDRLRVNKTQLATAAGLSRDAVSKRARVRTPATQARLQDMVQILNRVLAWSGTLQQAYAWYRSQPIPAFGDLTAEDLVKQGRAEDVKTYLSRIASGGYA